MVIIADSLEIDSKVDFVDVVVAANAEQLNITTVLRLHQLDFRLFDQPIANALSFSSSVKL